MYPRSVSYTERLAANPADATIKLVLPRDKEEAKDVASGILSEIEGGDPETARALVRAWTASDLYVLGLLSSAGQRINDWTGRPEIDHDLMFTQAREIQFDCDMVVDTTAREHWKSTWKTFLNVLRHIFLDPNVTIAVFSDTREMGYKHVARVKSEVETNPILKFGWGVDVLWEDKDNDPREAGASWSVRDGLTFKRTIVSLSPTLSAHSIRRLPVGSRFGIIIFDDIETEASTTNDEVRSEIISKIGNAMNLAGRGAEVWGNGTFHHPAGPTADLIENKGFRNRCFKAEDDTRPNEAPDPVKIYEECQGIHPITGSPLPTEFTQQRLAGPPTFLHPIEIILKRVRQDPATYAMQNMGDALGGLFQRFREDWVHRYEGTPEEWGEDNYVYLVADPSKGINDPWVIIALAATRDKKLHLLEIVRKKLPPDEFYQHFFSMAARWGSLGELQQIRVEEYGQANYAHGLRTHFDSMRFWGAPIYACANYEKDQRMREWEGLQPLFRHGKILLPKSLMVADERGQMYDVIDYFLRNELYKFPKPITDDIIAALALLGGNIKGRVTGSKERTEIPIIYPSGQSRRYADEMVPESQGGGTWMTEGW